MINPYQVCFKNLTGISTPITALNNATANELVTVGSTTTELDAESLLTWNGTNLGVGIATPTFVVGTGMHVSSAGGDCRIHITNATVGNGVADGAYLAMGSNGAAHFSNAENSYTAFSTNNTERMRIEANADMKLTGGDIYFATAGKGICLGATTNVDANTLDDYEEGTHASAWTTGNSGSITMNRNAMAYTKIGRVVTITGECDVSSVSSPNGGVRVSLPFTIASHSSGRNMTSITRPGMYHIPHSQDNPPVFVLPAGSSGIEGIYESDDGANSDYNVAAGEAIYFSFSYHTDA